MKKSGIPITRVIVYIGVLVAAYGIGICVREIRFHRAQIENTVAVKADKINAEPIAKTPVKNRPIMHSNNTTASANVPTADHISIKLKEDTSISITLTGSDPKGDPLIYRIVKTPSHGRLSSVQANLIGANLTYTPDLNYTGSDSFTYKVNNGKVNSDPAIVTLSVLAVNDPPMANPLYLTMKVDKSTAVVLSGNDVDNDALEFSIFTQPKHGDIANDSTFKVTGKLIYRPRAYYTGTDSFSYTVSDGVADSSPATVTINITPNHPPLVNLQTVIIEEDTATIISLTGSDLDSDDIVYSVVTDPSHGSLTGAPPNLTYTPNSDFHGKDTFTFKANDGTADSDLGTVSITVTASNDPPIANTDSIIVSEDVQTSVVLTGTDPDGDSLTFSIVTRPCNGNLSGIEPNLIYTPHPDYNGQDEFAFKVHDGTLDSKPATVVVQIFAVEDVPLPKSLHVKLKEDTSLPITLIGSDPDSDSLTFDIMTDPNHGQLTGKAPNLTYTPDMNFSSLDSFSFTVSDGKALSEPGTVSITVIPVDDPPIAKKDNLITQEDIPATINVLANDIELDNDILKVMNVTQGMNGSVTMNTDGALTYTPNAEFHGSDQFTYTVVDGGGETDTTTVMVVVSEVDDPPSITSSPITMAMVKVPYIYDVDARDPDGTDDLMYSLTAQPSGMTINSSTGLIEWIPTENHKNTTHHVEVKVVNRNNISVSGIQAFNIDVTPSPPKKAILTVQDGYDHRTKKRMSATGTTSVVQASDDKHQDISGANYFVYDFSDIFIPTNATLTSVVVCVEHFENGSITHGTLRWAVGTNWPDKPKVWISVKTPTREGKHNESIDTWDVTSSVDSPEKLHMLQLQIQNNNIGTRKKSIIDQVYIVVEWDWTVTTEKSIRPDTELVQYSPDTSQK